MCDILRRLAAPNLTKNQYLSCLNEFSRLCRAKRKEDDDDISTMDDVFHCLKKALFHDAAEVRAAALRAIRYLLKDEVSIKSMLRVSLPIFIVRSIDIVLENRTERIQALRLVRKFLSISPHLFPSVFTRSLIAIAQDGQIEHDALTRASWALLAELSIMSPVSSTKDTRNCAFNAIMDATLTGNQSHGMCESLISTLLYMLNWPRYRCLIHADLDLQTFVAPFTDSHYTAPVAKDYKQRMNQPSKYDIESPETRESRFIAAKITLISILRSWQGLIYLCEPQSSECNLVSNSCLKSLVNMLYLPYHDVRRRLIELIFELLYLPLPDPSSDFESGLKILERHQLSKDSWKIHDAFVIDEAKAILPPLRSRPRLNLVNDYMALLLVALFHCDVVDALSEVIITPSSQENSIRATILLHQLLSLSYQHLPTDSFSQYLTLGALIKHATSRVDDSRDLANAALINLGRVHPLKKSSNFTSAKCSLFLGQILEFCTPQLVTSDGVLTNNSPIPNTVPNTSTISSISTIASHRTNNSSSSSTSTLVNMKVASRSPSISSRSPSMLSRSPSFSAATSLFTLLSFPSGPKSNLKTIIEQSWELWDWEHVNFILTRPSDAMKKMSSQHYRIFMRRLVHFFKPSSKQYSSVDTNDELSRQLCETGFNMVDFLVGSSEPKATELLKELLHDISISMHDPDISNHNNNYNINSGNTHNTNSIGSTFTPVYPHMDSLLNSQKLLGTMSSTYFLFIGRLSSTMKGYQLLEKSSLMKLINNLAQTSMAATSPAEVYIRLIITCFDYTKEFNGSRKLLEEFLFKHPEKDIRVYATNFLRVLLRANVPDFSAWAIELLVRQLESPMRVVHFAAADVLDEACDCDENLEGLIGVRNIVDSKNETKSTLDVLRSAGDVGILLLCRYASSSNGLKYLLETSRKCLSCPLDSVLSDLADDNKEPGSANHSTTDGGIKGVPIPATAHKSILIVESEFDVELDRWQRKYNYRYVKLVEDVLNNSLTYHQKGEDGKYGRRVDTINPKTKNSYLPPHLYGQLALNPEGIEIILTRKLMEPQYEIIRKPPADLNHSELAVLRFKAALWIIGHVGSSDYGYQILENSRELIKLITGIARDASVLSLRGTAFYVLGLLGSTDEGAEEMKEHRWIVQKSNKIALPLDLDLILTRPQDDTHLVGDQIDHERESPIECCNGAESGKGDEIGKNGLKSEKLLEVTQLDADDGKINSNAETSDEKPRSPINSSDTKSDGTLTFGLRSSSQPISPITPPSKTSKINSSTSCNDLLATPTASLHPKLKEFYTMNQLEQIRRDVLKYVHHLTKALYWQSAENSLLNMKRKFGLVFQFDLELYAEVCNQLSSYNFRLGARRFLQELFLDIRMSDD